VAIAPDGSAILTGDDQVAIIWDGQGEHEIMRLHARTSIRHSEGAVEPPGFKLGPFGSRGLGQLAFDKGMLVLAASQTEGVALESAKIQQGLLTYALVHDALEAGLAADKAVVTRNAWLKYGADRVPQLYREIRAGKLRHLIPYDLNDARTKEAVQRPALFDFTIRKRPIVLTANAVPSGN
jgi:hypothetical protein